MSGSVGSIVHTGPVFGVERLCIRMRSGAEAVRDVVRHPGAVCVAGLLGDGRLVTIRNYRIAVGEWLEEFCAGKLERGEDPADAARRELLEETGYRASHVEPLGCFYTSPGFADERMHAFLATGLEHVGQSLQDDERIEVQARARDELAELVRTGAVRDGKTIATWTLLELRLRGQ